MSSKLLNLFASSVQSLNVCTYQLRTPSQQGKVAKPDGGIKIMQDFNLSKQRARALRKNMAEAERKLWGRLRGQQLGIRFRRQVVLGRYIVDFVCLDPKIIIEVDGSQHADDIHYDELRTKWLESLGYRVLRYWNNEVLQQLDTVLDAIWKAC